VQETVRRRGVLPRRELVLHHDPERMPLWPVVRYVLRIPTNRVMIVASAVGYFFFAGLRTFAVEFTTRHYGLSKATVSGFVPIIGIGAVLGVLGGGRLADRLVRRGNVAARVVVPAVAYIVAAVLFAPAVFTIAVPLAVPLYVLAAAALSAANPPLDAARLDVMHFRLWGRAESVRTFLRMGAEAVSPVVFGFVADELGGTGGRGTGLEYAFLIMLLPLVANGVILLRGRRAYPGDVATAMASEEATTTGERARRSGHYD
jgi:MFS family permease